MMPDVIGTTCQDNIEDCLGECSNPGTAICEDGVDDYTCVCNDGYTGKNCSVRKHSGKYLLIVPVYY
jgi:hypothetical protein